MVKILCLIPARSGSKGIKDKNIKEFCGYPLIAWTINQAKNSKYAKNMRIIVSTDNQQYAIIANAHGAETPFKRPTEISQDLSTDIEFVKHAVDWLKINNDYEPDIILQLRPTQPNRKTSCIDKCLDLFIQYYDTYDSLRSVVLFDKSPYKMYTIENVVFNNAENAENAENDNIEISVLPKLNPIFREINGITEPYNQCRQALPKTYLHNGYIDIFKTSLLEENSISGEKIYPYVMDPEDTIDIDTPADWGKAELRQNQNNICHDFSLV